MAEGEASGVGERAVVRKEASAVGVEVECGAGGGEVELELRLGVGDGFWERDGRHWGASG